MYEALTALVECFMTGVVAGLVIWFMAKIGLIPILLVTYEDKDKGGE